MYKAFLHIPSDLQKRADLNKEIAECRCRYVKAYIRDLNLSQTRAKIVKEHIQQMADTHLRVVG